MAKDGFPFGYFVFTDCSKYSTILHCFQDLKYAIKVKTVLSMLMILKSFMTWWLSAVCMLMHTLLKK